MAPEFNFGLLTDDELIKICEKGEEGAGYHPFQKASVLLSCRMSETPDAKNMALETDRWLVELPEEQIANLRIILEGE